MHSASRQWLLFISYLLVQAFVKHTHKIFTSMEGNQWLQLQSAVLPARDEEHTIRCWMTASKEESQLKASKALGKLLPGWLCPHERVRLRSSVHSRLEAGLPAAPAGAAELSRHTYSASAPWCALTRQRGSQWAPLPWEPSPPAVRLNSLGNVPVLKKI